MIKSFILGTILSLSAVMDTVADPIKITIGNKGSLYQYITMCNEVGSIPAVRLTDGTIHLVAYAAETDLETSNLVLTLMSTENTVSQINSYYVSEFNCLTVN